MRIFVSYASVWLPPSGKARLGPRGEAATASSSSTHEFPRAGIFWAIMEDARSFCVGEFPSLSIKLCGVCLTIGEGVRTRPLVDKTAVVGDVALRLTLAILVA